MATKATQTEGEGEFFSFEHGGETFTAARTFGDVVTPGFMRRHRADGSLDITFALLEEMFDQAALDAIDSMSWPEHRQLGNRFSDAFAEYLEVTMGESSAS